MKNKKIYSIMISLLLIGTSIFLVNTASADWDVDDGHKMHFPQLPDPNGWDVSATYPNILADDWRCSETGNVMDIHFWGSWYQDNKGTISFFQIGIYSDIPADQSGTGYSMPGTLLWEREINDWIEAGPFSGDQGWFWPETDQWVEHDHDQYYQYNIFLEDDDWFWQEKDTIYWLAISAHIADGTLWGWKSTQNHWNDDAVWMSPTGGWQELYEPSNEPPKSNQFWLTMIGGEPVEGGGTDYYDDGTSFHGWYYYPYYWPEIYFWNIWFYDHPFAPERYKEIYVSFFYEPMGPDPVGFVVNYATDIWSSEITGRPPLPQDIPDPQTEDLWIGRLPSPFNPIMIEPGYNEFYFTIPDYNPEWVSIDFFGTDFMIIDGIITHDCLPKDRESLDLAFVITGESLEPCIDIEKKVWDDVNDIWVEEIDAEVCTNVEFKIDVENCGNVDLQIQRIVDTLPSCLEYVTGSSTVDGNPKEPSVSTNTLTWSIPDLLEPGSTITIKFKAHVISGGENRNSVSVIAKGDGQVLTASDSAIVNGIGTASLDIEKLVSKDGGITWSDEVEAIVCETVRFRITVHNDGEYDLTNIKVVDILPDCLEYENNAIPYEPSISGNILTWTFPGPLEYCNTITIEFDAHVISEGENINEVTVTADYDDGSITGTATATVWAGGGMPVPKIGCDGDITLSDVKPGDTVYETIYVKNIGDTNSNLKWRVCGEPTWGTWTFNPDQGDNLKPSDGLKAINVTIIAPNEKNKQFTGEIELCNEDDSTDTCTIQVSLSTPERMINWINLTLLRLLLEHPIMLLLIIIKYLIKY